MEGKCEKGKLRKGGRKDEMHIEPREGERGTKEEERGKEGDGKVKGLGRGR